MAKPTNHGHEHEHEKKKCRMPLDNGKNTALTTTKAKTPTPMKTTPNARKPRTADEGKGGCPGEYHPAVCQLTQLNRHVTHVSKGRNVADSLSNTHDERGKGPGE
jgi:hypothetical protein